MTQQLDIEELQNLLKTVVDETTSITEKLATKASKILSKHASEKIQILNFQLQNALLCKRKLKSTESEPLQSRNWFCEL